MKQFAQISKEDLLIKLSILKAENTLLKKQIQEAGKDKAYIQELEDKIKTLKIRKTDAKYIELLELQIKNKKEKIKRQSEVITGLTKQKKK